VEGEKGTDLCEERRAWKKRDEMVGLGGPAWTGILKEKNDYHKRDVNTGRGGADVPGSKFGTLCRVKGRDRSESFKKRRGCRWFGESTRFDGKEWPGFYVGGEDKKGLSLGGGGVPTPHGIRVGPGMWDNGGVLREPRSRKKTQLRRREEIVSLLL